MFTTNLFHAIEVADAVSVGCVALEASYWSSNDEVMTLELANDTHLDVPNQPIEVDERGTAAFKDTSGREHRCRFTIISPMTEAHCLAGVGFPSTFTASLH
jgi:hypothetical protein